MDEIDRILEEIRPYYCQHCLQNAPSDHMHTINPNDEAKTAIQKLITEARIDENYRLASTISNEKSTYSKHIMIAMTDDRIETLQQSLQKEG